MALDRNKNGFNVNIPRPATSALMRKQGDQQQLVSSNDQWSVVTMQANMSEAIRFKVLGFGKIGTLDAAAVVFD
jgi:hypothetical protein